MPTKTLPFLLCTALFLFWCGSSFASQSVEEIVQQEEKLLIAMRGSAAGFHENNLAATIFAAQGGADFIEQELVLTRDDQLVVFGDVFLDTKTDVADIYPEKAREDGRFYVFDFSLAELRSLTLVGDETTNQSYLHIPSFEETLVLVKALEKTQQRTIGIYPKLIKTWYHKIENKDISAKLLYTLKSHGYHSRQDAVYIQSYDTDELQRMKNNLMPMLQMDIPLVQLLGDNDGDEMQQVDGSFISPYNYDWMLSNFGLRSLATYADVVGMKLYRLDTEEGSAKLSKYIDNLHRLGIKIHLNLEDEREPLQEPLNSSILESGLQPELDDPVKRSIYTLNADGIVVKDSEQMVDNFKAMKELKEKEAARPSIHNLLPHLMPETKPSTKPKNSPLSILKELQ